jgi:hypothetical protein
MNSECSTHFPIVDGIPVLINEQASVFSIDDDYLSKYKPIFGNLTENGNKLKKAIRSLIPTINKNMKGKSNYFKMSQILLSQSTSPRVLVIGGRILGQGMNAILDSHVYKPG